MVNRQFADAFYFIALLNDMDADHDRVAAIARTNRSPIVTTEFVLIEVADALAGTRFRTRVSGFVRMVRGSRSVEVVEATSALMERGLRRYAARLDKQWTLTDCISFEVMEERGLTEALTHDHHFTQAGFRELL